jgi:pentatricopeptide repeat protein
MTFFQILHSGVIVGQRRRMHGTQISSIRRHRIDLAWGPMNLPMDGTKAGCHGNSFSWNRMFGKYVKAGQHEKAVELFQEIQQKKHDT